MQTKHLNKKDMFLIGYASENFETCQISKKISDYFIHEYDSNNIIFKNIKDKSWNHFGGPKILHEEQVKSKLVYKTFDQKLWKTKSFARKQEDIFQGYKIRAVSNVDRLHANQTLRIMFQIHNTIGNTRHHDKLPAPILQSQQMNIQTFTCDSPNEISGVGECYGKFPRSLFRVSTILSLNLLWPNEQTMGIADFARIRLEQHNSASNINSNEVHAVAGFGYIIDGLHTITDFYTVDFAQRKKINSKDIVFRMDVLSDNGERSRDILSARCEENCEFDKKSNVTISSLFRKFYTINDTIQVHIIRPNNFSVTVDDSVLSKIEPCLSPSIYQHSALHLTSNDLQLDHMARFESSDTNIVKLVNNEVYGVNPGRATISALGKYNSSQIVLGKVDVVVEDTEEEIEYIDAILLTGLDDSFMITQNLKTHNAFIYATAIYKNGDKHELYPNEYDLVYDKKEFNIHKNEVSLIQDQDTTCTTTKLRIRSQCSLKSFPISLVL